MRKLLLLLCLPALSTVCFAATPIHVTLKSQSAVIANADGFFSLASIAALSGGTAAEREKIGAVCIGRAPLSNEVRRLTLGDISLKLRQAGFRPQTDAVIDGAPQVSVTVGMIAQEALPAPNSVDRGGAGQSDPHTPPLFGDGGPLLVHRGDAVNIVIQEDDLSITAKGVARDAGRAGDAIHVHREGIMTDLSVTVLDAQNVQLEM